MYIAAIHLRFEHVLIYQTFLKYNIILWSTLPKQTSLGDVQTIWHLFLTGLYTIFIEDYQKLYSFPKCYLELFYHCHSSNSIAFVVIKWTAVVSIHSLARCAWYVNALIHILEPTINSG